MVVLGGGSFGTAMAAHVANKKTQMEVSMLVRDPAVCQSINENHCNWWGVSFIFSILWIMSRFTIIWWWYSWSLIDLRTLSIFTVLRTYFPERKLPENVIATADARTALLGADYCLHAVPMQAFQVVLLCWWLLHSKMWLIFPFC